LKKKVSGKNNFIIQGWQNLFIIGFWVNNFIN